MMSWVSVIFLTLSIVLIDGVDDTDDCITHCLDNLLIDIIDLDHDIEELDNIKNEVDSEIQELSSRLTKHEGLCTPFWEFNCGGAVPQCVEYYLLCDGSNDCPNGADEKLCDIFLKSGTHWHGAPSGQLNPYNILNYTLDVPEPVITDYFPSVPEISFEYPTLYEDGRKAVFTMSGFYHYGENRIYYWDPRLMGNELGVVEQLHGRPDVVIERDYPFDIDFSEVDSATPIAGYYLQKTDRS